MIEEVSIGDPVLMQQGFNAYDDCSTKSKNRAAMKIMPLSHIIQISELDDECDTAAEIYSCGRQKEPLIVDAIISTNKGNGSVVRIKYFEFRTACL
jgi:hypothetical protein